MDRNRLSLRRPRRVLFSLLLFVGLPANALKTDADQPVNIRARAVDANEKTGIATYRGDVVFTQGSLRIHADRIEVLTRDNRVQSVHAAGKPIKMRARSDRGEELRASAQRLEYSAPRRQLNLYGEVVVERGLDVLNGATVRYNFGSEDFSAEGNRNGRVSAVIQPAPASGP